MAAPKNARDLFLEALGRAPPDRAAYLDEACGDDAPLRQRVEALLRANDDPGAFLGEVKPGTPSPPAEAANGASAPPPGRQPETEEYVDPTARVGSILAGKYKLIEEIGEGGMGSVYMAQQTEPVKRAVAVKVIKAGMDSRAVLARFEAERQALAMMDHPNIAKVLDAGTTQGGGPFFVMELVKGKPITRYCDEHKLTPRQRLELFVPVCQAIQHAHQKGVIHRDIKPSNVIVAMYDDRPVPKVIDFGVAKAAGHTLTDKTLMTGFGAVVGTPEYMSPEQANLNNLDIDTRSDVYSLGVLLYELLTGTTPVDRKSLGKAALLEILRIVREVEAPRPSDKVSTIDTLANVAANRGMEPAKLSKLLKGELDWLVLKALEKDRTRRYETANGLSRDIQRYLANEIVEARPPSAGYLVRKFVRRNRTVVVTVVVIALAIMLGAAISTWQAIRATHAEAQSRLDRDQAEESFRAARAAVDDYFTEVSESKLLKVPGLQPLRKDLLERALKYYQSFIEQRGGDPRVKAELAATYYRVAFIRHYLGSYDLAVDSYQKALTLYDQLIQAEPGVERFEIDRAIVCNDLSTALEALGRREGALQVDQQALEARRKLARSHPDEGRFQNELAKSLFQIGRHYLVEGKLDEALKHFEESRDLDQRWVQEPLSKLRNFPSDLGRNFNNPHRIRADLAAACFHIGTVHQQAGRTTASLVAYQQALEAYEFLVHEDPQEPDFRAGLGATLIRVAAANSLEGRQNESLTRYRRAAAILQRLEEENPAVTSIQGNLAQCHYCIGVLLSRTGAPTEALAAYEKARDIQQRLADANPTVPGFQDALANTNSGIGQLLSDTGKPAEALVAFEKGLAVSRKLALADPKVPYYQREVARALNNIAQLHVRQKRFAEAFVALDEALAIGQKVVDAHPTIENFTQGLGYTYAYRGWARVRAGQPVGAATDLRQALELWAKIQSPSIETRFERSRVLALLAGLGADEKSGVTAGEARTYADQALAALQDALRAGWALPNELKEPDFDALRSRPDFQKLVAEVEARAEKPLGTAPLPREKK
jgi:serine/threonine protein kinase/tetratricopeptide (TPR) repeat protein